MTRSVKPGRRPKNPENEPKDKKQIGLPARQTARGMIGRVIDQRQSLEQQILEPAACFGQLSVEDQGLAKAIAVTALRHRCRIEACLAKLWSRPPPKRARSLHHALLTAAAQILFMRVPEHVAVNLAISDISANPATKRFSGFANGLLRNLARQKTELLDATKEILPFAPWLKKQLASDFGSANMKKIGAMVALEPNIDLHLNNARRVEGEFDPDQLPVIQLPYGHLRLYQPDAVQSLPGFDQGYWWVQDFAASLPVRLLGDVEGKTIADLCAAPGGKTMQLAARGAKVSVVDISKQRCRRLEKNLERTGLEAEIIIADVLKWQPAQQYDAIVLDAPCTATGTMRRHPEILWTKTPEDIASLVQLQKTMIERAFGWLRPGGVLVYANCSILKQEGEDLVAELIAQGATLDPILPEEFDGLKMLVNRQATLRCLPFYLPAEILPMADIAKQANRLANAFGGMDGFFAARFRCPQ